MRDVKNLRTRAAADKAWTVNNSIYQGTSKELHSMLECTKRLIKILDANYEKANLRAYIDDLLCITKGSLDVHLSKLKRVCIRLRDA